MAIQCLMYSNNTERLTWFLVELSIMYGHHDEADLVIVNCVLQ